MLAVEAVSVRKVYRGFFRRTGGQTALAGLDIAIPKGSAFGLIGLNGAGKTTFIKTLLGVVRPTSGAVRVLGGDPEDPRVRARIGYLPERLFLTNAFTPRQFLASVARMKGLPRDEAALRAQIERVGLGADADRRIGGFSKGMRQRLGLAAALLGEPELLILDEPTDGVDPLGRAEIRRILGEERARGATLFLNSHLLSETERVCDRIAILARGRLVREGALLDLCGSETAYRARFVAAGAAAGVSAAVGASAGASAAVGVSAAVGASASAAVGAEAAAGVGTGLPVEALAEIGFRATDVDGMFRIEAESPAVLNERLDRARRAGALLVELSRDLRDLEDVLAEALGEGGR